MDNYYGQHTQSPQQYTGAYQHPNACDNGSLYEAQYNTGETPDNYQHLEFSFQELTQRNNYLNKVLKAKDSELGAIYQRCKDRGQRIQNLQNQVRELRKQKVSYCLPSQKPEVVNEKASLPSAKEENIRLNRENQALHQQKVELEKKLKSENEKCSELQSNWDDLTTHKSELEKSVEMYEIQVKNLEEKLSCLEDCSKEELEDKLSKANAQILVLKSEFKSSCKEVTLMRDKSQKVMEDVRKLEKEREELQKEKAEIISKNQEEREKLEEEKAEVISKNQEEIGTLKEKLRRRVGNASTKPQQSDEDLEKLQKEHETLKQDFEKLKQELNGENDRADQATKMAQEHSNKIVRTNKRYEDLKLQMERKCNFITALKKLLAKTENEAKEACETVKELKVEVDSLKLEKDNLNGYVNSGLDEIRQLKSKLRESHMKERAWNEKLKTAQNQTETTEQLRLANKELETRVENLQLEMKGDKFMVNLQKQSMDEKNTKISELQEKAVEINMKLEEQEKSISSKAGRIKLLLNQLRSREQDYAQLQRELDKMKARWHYHDLKPESKAKKPR